MQTSRSLLDLPLCTLRMAAIALSLTPLCYFNASAQKVEAPKPAATTTVTPKADFQFSTITSSTNDIEATTVPTVDASGKLHYWDVSLLFDVDSEGNVTIATGYPKATPSQYFNSGHFRAGTYIAPSSYFSGNGVITVTGPTNLQGGGTAWTSSLPSGSNGYTDPSTAVWYVESLTNNPLAARIKAAGITSTQWSYGLGSGWGWYGNSLLGFMQVGDTITIALFTDAAGNDYSSPVGQITYTLK